MKRKELGELMSALEHLRVKRDKDASSFEIEWMEGVEQLREKMISSMVIRDSKQAQLFWIGNKVHLFELGLAVYLSGEVNDGKIGVCEFFRYWAICSVLTWEFPRVG